MIGPGVTIVAGTDTDVGKTVATAWLAHQAIRDGFTVAVYKPAQTGIVGEEPGDVDVVATLAPGASVSEGVRLPEPLAPVRAAIRAGVALPGLDEHVVRVRELAAAHDIVLVEGSGGITVELAEGAGLADLGRAVGAGAVVVARAGLGTLNHTALTCRAIRDAGLEITGVLVGSWPDDPDLATRCNALDLPAYAGAPLLGGLWAGCSSDLDHALVTPQEMTRVQHHDH